MNKDQVRQVLASYSPPLSSSQMDEAAERIARMSATEFESLKKEELVQKPKRR